MMRWVGYMLLVLELSMGVFVGLDLERYSLPNNAIDIWFDHKDPTLTTYNTEREIFGASPWLLMTVSFAPAAGGDWQEHIDRLTHQLEMLPHVMQVRSATSLNVLQKDEEGLFFDVLPRIPQARDRLVRHPIAGELITYRDQPRVWTFMLQENIPSDSKGIARQEFVDSLRSVLDHDGAIEHYTLSGPAVINAELNRLSWQDFLMLIPLTCLITSLLGVVALRGNMRLFGIALLSTGSATICVIAIMVFAGHPFNMMTISLPGIFFTLGLASSLHIVNWMASELTEGLLENSTVAQGTRRETWRPIVVSHMTTASGFLSLFAINIVPIELMAVFGALGVFLLMLNALFILPQLVQDFGAPHLIKVSGRKVLVGHKIVPILVQRFVFPVFNWLGNFKTMCVALIVASMFWGLGMSRVLFDSTYITMVSEEEVLAKDYAWLEQKTLPSASLSIFLDTGQTTGRLDAELVRAIRDLEAELLTLPGVIKTVGPAEIYAEVAPALAEGFSSETSILSASNDFVTDVFVFALSGGSREIVDYVHPELAELRIQVFFPYLNNHDLHVLVRDHIEPLLDKHLSEFKEVSASVSGLAVLWANMDDAIYRGQWVSLLFMAGLSFMAFWISTRHTGLAMAGAFINIAPILTLAAILGFLEIPIDIATVFILGVTLGIAIDDTSFFIHKACRAGVFKNPFPALRETLQHTALPMVATTFIIFGGFSVLLVSNFVPLQQFGLLTALGVLMATLFDLFILASLVYVATSRKRRLSVGFNAKFSS